MVMARLFIMLGIFMAVPACCVPVRTRPKDPSNPGCITSGHQKEGGKEMAC